ncbi:adhesin [Streptococcus sp. DD12]|uniref:adhesin n=1 Tax=Streptococcus sp. DD12 TaxID=1777880 RepID=UPI000796FAE4|nr:adhesin [Streptococcus sp. DD12]KXT76966.1 hypothetical protein STRDD12_00100 [Streptococcus sp. DD12]
MTLRQDAKKYLGLFAATTILATASLPSVAVFAQETGQAMTVAAGGGGADTQSYDYTGTTNGVLTANATETSLENTSAESTSSAQNVALAQNAGTLKLNKVTLNKSGDDDDADNDNFYGVNSILLAVNSGSKAYLGDSSLSASSTGSNGIFATDKASVYANNSSITTTADNSRGLDATYGGNILANKMTIATQGDHSAALATDRGGGNISVTNSQLTTAGSGSPLLYSTGTIEVDNVTGTSSGSQLAGMEGLNTIRIYNSQLQSSLTGTTGSDPVANGVILYQSTSGDAETTTSETARFEASQSTLSSAISSGAMFYVTNTKANVVLSDTTLDFDTSKANLLTIAGNDSNNWGTAGSNGATVTFTGLKQTLKGNISVDTISSLDLYLLDGTTYTGSTMISQNATNTSPTTSPITVNIDGKSKWVVTGDSTISNLNLAKGGQVVDSDGKTVTIVANGQTVVKGESDKTVTVTGTYSTTVTTSENNALSTDYIDRTDFDNYYKTSTSFGSNASNSASSSKSSTSQQKTKASHSYLPYALAGGVSLLVIGAGTALLVKKRGHKKNK